MTWTPSSRGCGKVWSRNSGEHTRPACWFRRPRRNELCGVCSAAAEPLAAANAPTRARVPHPQTPPAKVREGGDAFASTRDARAPRSFRAPRFWTAVALANPSFGDKGVTKRELGHEGKFALSPPSGSASLPPVKTNRRFIYPPPPQRNRAERDETISPLIAKWFRPIQR